MAGGVTGQGRATPPSPGLPAVVSAADAAPQHHRWGDEELSPPSLVGSLLPCVICNRTFLPEALSRHHNICQKTANKKRKVFNSSHQRLQGTGIDPEAVHRSPSPPPRRRSSSRSSWREKHTQLLNTVRSARGAPVAAPPSTAPPPDYEQCPFCARHFGPKAADRHISWCKEQKSRLPDQRPEAAVAKGRLNARTKYVAPLPLKPRPKRVSTDRLSREVSPAVSAAPAPATVRSPVRVTRDYAKEYREKASQEREQRLQERKKSPAAVSSGYGKQTPVSRYSREGSEPPHASPPKETFRRTQSFRTRPGAAGRGSLRTQRTGKQPAAEREHKQQQQQQQQRDEPDGGEDVAPDRHNYQRSVSTPSERQPTPPRPLSSFTSSVGEVPGPADTSPAPLPSPAAAADEVYITRSQLDEYQRLSDAVKQDEVEPRPGTARAEGAASASPSSQLTAGPPPSLEELDASMTSEVTSDGEGADTYRVTSSQTRRRLQQSGARKSGRSLAGQLELTGRTLQPSPRRERAEAAPPAAEPPQQQQVKPVSWVVEEKPASARGRPARRLLSRGTAPAAGEKTGAEPAAPPAREARTPDEVFADSLEDLITVSECPVLVKPTVSRGTRPRGRSDRGGDAPASSSASLPALAPAPRPRPRPRRGVQRLTLPPLQTRSGPPGGRSEPTPQPPAPPARTLLTPDYDPYLSAQKQLEELLGNTEPSSPSPPRAHPSPPPPQSVSPPAAPYCPTERPSFPSEGAEGASVPRAESPGRSAFAQVARPHSALTRLYPLPETVVKPTPLQPVCKDPIAEAISILNEYASSQRGLRSTAAAQDDDEEPPSSPESSNTVINKYEFVSSTIARYNEDRESRTLRESVSQERSQTEPAPLSRSSSASGSPSKSGFLSKSASGSAPLSKSASESRPLSKSASESRSPEPAGALSRSPVGSGVESRSPVGSGVESRSPVGSRVESRSPIGSRVESRSPAGSGVDSWSRGSSVPRGFRSGVSDAAADSLLRSHSSSLSPSAAPAGRSPSPTNSRSPTNSGVPAAAADSRRQGGTAGSPEPPADAAATHTGWAQHQWRPIESGSSSNRSSVERNGGHPELQFSRMTIDGSSSPSGSLYEAEMPDFDLIMEQARRASERKASALSPRKARMRGLDMRQMMGVEVADLNLKNSGAPTQKFCHECGSGYPVKAAKFCCNCGAQRLI